MKAIATWCLLGGMLALQACATPKIDLSPEAAAKVRAQPLGDLPYHPLVFHLDLSILTYQLYSQSLVWPFDPYYEDLDNAFGDRGDLMSEVRQWALTTGSDQVDAGAGIEGYRGPGLLSGFDDNDAHDPIVYQYSRLHPWSTSITNPEGRWVEYLTPGAITDKIREVYVCYRSTGQPEGSASLEEVVPRRDDWAPGAADILMAFEGGTGDKGESGQPASHSLMGFVLLRAGAAGDYDLHIAFRGSRSGLGSRAAWEAFSTGDAGGNPDWITDLGYREVDAPHISTTGRVSRGMSRSMLSIFPQLFHCLDQVVGRERNAAPRNIYVTGHSLGGGLAQHFVSALLLGNLYGPGGDQMPDSLRTWPWGQVKLITYSAPRVGDDNWAERLTVEQLQSQLFVSSPGSPYDQGATGVTNLQILPRLLDATRPAAYRVLIPTDPITTERIPGGQHIGQTVYVEQPSAWDALALPDFEAHEPTNVRQRMVETLRDDRIPPSAWAYHDMEALNPSRDDDEAGHTGEYLKLGDAVRTYYASGDRWFDEDAFDVGFEIFLELRSRL